MKDTEVTIEVYTSHKAEVDDLEEQASIILTQLPQNVDESFIEMFFENRRKFGDTEVVSVVIDRETASSVVRFTEARGKFFSVFKYSLHMIRCILYMVCLFAKDCSACIYM